MQLESGLKGSIEREGRSGMWWDFGRD